MWILCKQFLLFYSHMLFKWFSLRFKVNDVSSIFIISINMQFYLFILRLYVTCKFKSRMTYYVLQCHPVNEKWFQCKFWFLHAFSFQCRGIWFIKNVLLIKCKNIFKFSNVYNIVYKSRFLILLIRNLRHNLKYATANTWMQIEYTFFFIYFFILSKSTYKFQRYHPCNDWKKHFSRKLKLSSNTKYIL